MISANLGYGGDSIANSLDCLCIGLLQLDIILLSGIEVQLQEHQHSGTKR